MNILVKGYLYSLAVVYSKRAINHGPEEMRIKSMHHLECGVRSILNDGFEGQTDI